MEKSRALPRDDEQLRRSPRRTWRSGSGRPEPRSRTCCGCWTCRSKSRRCVEEGKLTGAHARAVLQVEGTDPSHRRWPAWRWPRGSPSVTSSAWPARARRWGSAGSGRGGPLRPRPGGTAAASRWPRTFVLKAKGRAVASRSTTTTPTSWTGCSKRWGPDPRRPAVPGDTLFDYRRWRAPRVRAGAGEFGLRSAARGREPGPGDEAGRRLGVRELTRYEHYPSSVGVASSGGVLGGAAGSFR